jgi:hypothetical protein
MDLAIGPLFIIVVVVVIVLVVAGLYLRPR